MIDSFSLSPRTQMVPFIIWVIKTALPDYLILLVILCEGRPNCCELLMCNEDE